MLTCAEVYAGGPGVVTLTGTPESGFPSRSTTFTPSTPCVLEYSMLGATSESILIGSIRIPTIGEVTVVVMCKYSLFLLELPQLGVPPVSSVIHFALELTLYLTPSTSMVRRRRVAASWSTDISRRAS